MKIKNSQSTTLIFILAFLISCQKDTEKAQESISTNTEPKNEVQVEDIEPVDKVDVKGQYSELNQFLNQLQDENKILGSFQINQNGDKLFSKSITKNKNENPIYEIGSITKTFTATLTLLMIENSQLSLADTLNKFFPQIPNSEKISIEQLLNHSSGLANYTAQKDFMQYFQSPQSQAQMIERISNYEAVFEPGAKTEYSNSNYLLLGYILENMSGKTYAELLAKYITTPLNLTNTTYTDSDKSVGSYMFAKQWQAIPHWDKSTAAAAGAILSTSDDLQTFFHSLFGLKIINQVSLDSMLELNNEFGKGIFKRVINLEGEERIGYWHNGKIEEFNSYMIYFPKERIGVSFLINGMNTNAKPVFDALLNSAFNPNAELPKMVTVEISEDIQSQFVGYYTSESFPLDIEITFDDKQLYAKATGQSAFPLNPVSEYEYGFDTAGIRITFDKNKEEFTIVQNGNASLFVKSEKPKKETVKVSIDNEVLKSYTGNYTSPAFPLDIKIILNGDEFMAQATGQAPFPLTASSESQFGFEAAGITIEFDSNNNTLSMTQAGNTTEFTKEN